MIAIRRPDALRPLAILLALVMLVFATMADAATCGSELPAASGVSAASSIYETDAHGQANQDNPDAPAEQHGVCSHGHCHHGSNIEGSPTDVASNGLATSHLSGSFADLHSVDREIVSPPPRA